MTFSKQLFLLLLLFIFLFPLGHASNPKKCSSSFKKPLRCGPLEVPIRFPFCDHPRFNLHCDNRNKTVLELPMSGTFLVRDIDYINQQIYISDPEKCLVKRLFTFNMTGSPFYFGFDISYTFFTCPNEVVLPYWFQSFPVPCLSNSTSTFAATTDSDYDLLDSMFPSCKIVKRLRLPVIWSLFSSYFNNESLKLEWDLPNCRGCAMSDSRCGFKNTTSLEIKCFSDKKSGVLSTVELVLVICASIVGAIILFATCIAIRIYNSQRFATSTTTMMRQPREIRVPRGLNQSTIESYKKMELGESRRLPGTNGIECTICLSDYASKEIVRFIPKCNHCFHVECIDPWLRIHGSCPLCRNSSA